ncbi:hypothetical protein HYU16_05035 [Candidatus Woesearchaeota archaeon]|nr:hypothetical protein [Candidatus Woesearchaeota archaeon]
MDQAEYAKEYDELVVKIHRLYESMFSVNEWTSHNMGRSWEIKVTYGGVLTHSWHRTAILESILAASGFVRILRHYSPVFSRLQAVWPMHCLVNLYVANRFFHGNVGELAKTAEEFRKEYHVVAARIQDMINASIQGRRLPIKALMMYYVVLMKIRSSRAFAPFFTHPTYRGYLEDAVKSLGNQLNGDFFQRLRMRDDLYNV